MDNLVELLKTIKFTESEAKVYVALLKTKGCSGYEVSRLSGITRSRIYSILDALVLKGAVVTSTEENVTHYSAVPAHHLSQKVRQETNQTLEEIEQLAKSVSTQPSERVWHLNNYDDILNKCLILIEHSKESLLLQIWQEDLSTEFIKEINKKAKEIKNVAVILYDTAGEYKTALNNFYPHRFEKNKLEDIGHRWITLVSDNKEMIHASIYEDGKAQSIFTQNSSMVFFAKEYVLHDAYCLRLIDRMEKENPKGLESHMEGIRDIFSM